MPTAMQRERNIDILRGASIFAVLAYHFSWYSPISDRGLYGVLLFFLISGYCMEMSLKASSSALEFLTRRQSRLVPALIVCAITTHLVEITFPGANPDRAQRWPDVLMSSVCIPTLELPCGMANRLVERLGTYKMVDGAYWSLRVEFKFYALLLLLYFVITKRFHLLGILAVAIAGGAWLYFLGGNMRMRDFVPYLPYFATGAAVYEIRNGNARYGWAAMAASALVYFAFMGLNIMPYSMPPNIWAYLLCAAALLIIANAPDLAGWKTLPIAIPVKAMLFLGMISYPLYLLHQDIGLAFTSSLRSTPLLALIVPPIAIAAAALVVHLAVERSCERRVKSLLRKRFGRRAQETGSLVETRLASTPQ